MTWKDSYSAILSSLALIISGTSAYYSLFRVNLDAKLLIGGDQYPAYGENAGSITNIYWDVSLTFINNGNRPYSVQKIALDSFSVRTLDDKLADCRPLSEGNNIIFGGLITEADPNSFAPSVVDPGKIVILHPKFVDDPAKEESAVSLRLLPAGAVPPRIAPAKPPASEPISLIKADLPDGVVNLISCVRIDLVDHEGNTHMITRPVTFQRRVTAGADEGEAEAGPSLFIEKPVDLSGLLAQRQPARATPAGSTPGPRP